MKKDILDSRYDEAREKFGEEAALALKAHVDMIGSEFYMWLTKLYVKRDCKCENFDDQGNRVCLLPKDESGKPLCHGGGFYYSNSARDNKEFDIDIESTVQAIHFLNTAGMLKKYNGSFKKALPGQMKNDVCAFAKSLQDEEDGYFYHPQWGKEITPSRKGRDLRWATVILEGLGDMPLYDTKNGAKGSLGAPSGLACEKEEEADTNATWMPELHDIDSFREFLSAMDLKNKSYSSFNTINAIAEQITARDKKAEEDGENLDLGFVKTLEENFNSRQNPENGLWEDVVAYRSTNGLMKAVTSYNILGLRFKNAIAAFKSCIKMALLPPDGADAYDAKAYASVDVFNPWVAMRTIRLNVERFGTKEEIDEFDSLLRENLVSLIKVTTEKTRKFKKEDGSFGYTWKYSPYKSQSAPVSVPETVEGDVNGGTIAVGGILGHMCYALGIEKIPIYTDDDFEKYLDAINEHYR